jgi:hypothetical protein
LKAKSYIRSIDRRRMVEIEPGSFVNLRSARRLNLVAKPKRRHPKSAGP